MNKKPFENLMPQLDNEDLDLIRKISMGVGVLIYVMLIAFIGQKSYHLIANGLSPEAQSWAWVGVAGLVLNSYVLPLVMHFWAHEKNHGRVVKGAYIVDLTLIGLNAYTDWHFTLFQNHGTVMPQLAEFYMKNVAPLTPAIVIVIWALIYLSDPTMKSIHEIAKLKVNIQKNILTSMQDFTSSEDFQGLISQYAPDVLSSVINENLAHLLGESDLPVAEAVPPAEMPASPADLPVAEEMPVPVPADDLPVAEAMPVPHNNGIGPSGN